MLGRTYSLGHEPDLDDWLFDKPRRNATDPESRWAVWYPLRRKGEFSALPPEEQTPILREHGKIGHSFGEAGYAHDIRLACHGLDKNDNDFVIGLIGRDLYPALRLRASHAQDAPDVALHGTDGTVFRRQSHLAESECLDE